ncbi:MAG: ribonuclease Y [Thermodesulfobacteriota bacterium]|nr:MAG: ribonuclease Y [Thermodesulfobacteriota bacterium]
MVEYLLIGLISFISGSLAIWFLQKYLYKKEFFSAKQEAKQILQEAKQEAKQIQREASGQAKELLYQMRSEFEKETKEKYRDLQRLENRLLKREEQVEKKIAILEKKEDALTYREKELRNKEKEIEERKSLYERLLREEREKLEALAQMTSEEAKQLLLKQVEEETRHEAAKLIRQIENEAKEEANKKAKEILALAINRYAGEFVTEKTVSVVPLPSEEMKGRIIGREGRNIRALEAATGIDVIIDETPEVVVLSGFNPIRREVARLSLERLMADGRIHPARIEEVVNKTTQEVETAIRETGEQTCFDVGIHGFHPEIVKLLGKLKYRTSYGQNVLQHSMEVAFMAGIMASELGLDPKEAKRAGLLHDIGKAVDHEVEGPHALIGAELAKKYGETEAIVHAIAAHHEDVPPETVLAILVSAADTLSGARPGARKETLESYIKRIENLEKIAQSFNGVCKAYAIQAGREVRIIVESELLNDEDITLLAHDVAKRIEQEMRYPGQIKVFVIREKRAIAYAK